MTAERPSAASSPPGPEARRAFSCPNPGVHHAPTGPAPAHRRAFGQEARHFLRHLARTGSVAYAAELVKLNRNTLYRRQRTDPAFAAGWAEAIASAADLLNEEAMRRSVSDNGRAPLLRGGRRGRRLGSIRAYDSGLLIRLLRLHWPATYDRQGGWTGTPRELLARLGRK